MLDAGLRRLIDPPSEAIARQLAGLQASATVLIVAGLSAGLTCFVCIAAHWPLAGLGFLMTNRLLNGVSAQLARIVGTTVSTMYTGLVFDFLVRASIPFAFALADSSHALAAAFLILSFVVDGATLLAARAVTAGQGSLPAADDSKFGLEDGSLTGATVIFAAFALACIMPSWFGAIAYICGVSCFVLAGLRFATVIERQQ